MSVEFRNAQSGPVVPEPSNKFQGFCETSATAVRVDKRPADAGCFAVVSVLVEPRPEAMQLANDGINVEAQSIGYCYDLRFFRQVVLHLYPITRHPISPYIRESVAPIALHKQRPLIGPLPFRQPEQQPVPQLQQLLGFQGTHRLA